MCVGIARRAATKELHGHTGHADKLSGTSQFFLLFPSVRSARWSSFGRQAFCRRPKDWSYGCGGLLPGLPGPVPGPSFSGGLPGGAGSIPLPTPLLPFTLVADLSTRRPLWELKTFWSTTLTMVARVTVSAWGITMPSFSRAIV